jgi:O-antigen/teichoic acid export membrane protein
MMLFGWRNPGRLRWLQADGPRAAFASMRSPGVELTWVVLGKAALMATNTALLLFLATRLPLAEYGMFVAIAGAQVVLSRAVLAGMDGGVVRLSAADHLARSECISAGVAILRRTAIAIAACAALAAFAPLPWPRWIAPVVAAGAIGIALVDYGYFCRLARLDYRGASAIQGGMGALRLTATVSAVLAWPSHPVAVFVGYAAGSLMAGLVQIRAAARTGSRPTGAMVKRLFRYSVWQGAASIITAGALHAGTFVLIALKQPDAAGLFGLGLSLSLPFFFLYNAYFEFLLPRISRVNEPDNLGKVVLRWTAVALALACACVPVAAMAGMIFPRILRPGLAAVVPVFYWLASSNVFLLPQAVFEAASHKLLRPNFIAGAWAVRLAATVGAVFMFARGGGPVRAGAGQCFAAAIALVVIAFSVLGRIHGMGTPGRVLEAAGAIAAERSGSCAE